MVIDLKTFAKEPAETVNRVLKFGTRLNSQYIYIAIMKTLFTQYKHTRMLLTPRALTRVIFFPFLFFIFSKTTTTITCNSWTGAGRLHWQDHDQ